MSQVIELAKDLINRKSITPEDAGCQPLLSKRLKKLDFNIEPMLFHDTTNLWARRGTESPLFVFAGHTDVVPAGKETDWHTPPFDATEIDGYLYGRGAADMKGSLAAFTIALERFVGKHPDHKGSIGLLITSDEEGPFINGTTKVVETLKARNEIIDMCIVGEPSSTEYVGDVIKNGRRGSINGFLTIFGVQGHVAYSHLAENPVHEALTALTRLASTHWDEGNDYFPPTSFQIANINAGTGATNVIPGELKIQFNFRFSTELTASDIKKHVHQLLDFYHLNYQLEWELSGEPFLTDHGPLLEAMVDSITEINGTAPKLLTTGGTSDGRFIATMGTQVIELGPVNASIHKVNECVKMDDLEQLALMYEGIMEKLLG